MLTNAKFFANSRAFFGRHSRPISPSTTLEILQQSGRVKEADIQKYVQSTRIIVHPIARRIAKDFLSYKRTHGSRTEKHVYDTQINWDVDRLFIRLIKQRPLSFYGDTDVTLLRSGEKFWGATSQWDRVGTDNEHPGITMAEYLTYEEMMISSLIGVSGYTPYLNDGNRHNRGVLSTPQSIQHEGIQVGLVGARFERKGRMDCVYESISEPTGFPFLRYFGGAHFEDRYKARIRVTIETLLMEAEIRGAEAQKKVYVHVVGLGLGVWAVRTEQSRWYVEVFSQCLAEMKTSWIGLLEFAYIDVDPMTRKDVESAARRIGVDCVFNRRAPSARLPDQSMLLVTSYAWDSNSYPGNEFYLGMLNASGDPAAACSTAISETHNPEINTSMLESIHYLGS
ncbi:hypothetical protein C1H76_7595 [Elsinoe australis]|uniref:Uncharacterized protein n=1 Tax=Elsinoe australis TaxID=40998 RepID=A0A4U7AUU9_9PEZI|nr:hypothetical protein C1H76_7595 [Elsinoe australis]